jgi:hypothetical protein
VRRRPSGGPWEERRSWGRAAPHRAVAGWGGAFETVGMVLRMSDDTTRAAEVLDARLDRRDESRLVRAGRLVAGLIGGALASDGGAASGGVDLVVSRRDTGREVLRTEAGTLEEADRLLQAVRRDLDAQSVTEFAREWHLFES